MIDNQIKIITICGSMKYEKEMKEITLRLTLDGKTVLTPLFKTDYKTSFNGLEKTLLSKIHKEKIKLSDAIFVVNVNNYLGESTKKEIEFAKHNIKKIIYLVE